MGGNIIVTGVTSGIGLGLSTALLEKDCTILGIGRDISKLQRQINLESNKQFFFESFDLSDLGGIEELINNFISAHGKIDGFVHCAGIEETIPLSMYKVDKVRRIYEINVFAAIELLRIVSKKKNSNDGASFIFLSSVMGALGQSGKVGYCSTKAAILGMVKASAIELAKRKIRVNAVLPGIVTTPLTEKLFSELSEENISRIKDMHPLGIGEVGDITPVITFLLSNQSRWITGQSLTVDGGYSIQ